MQENRHANGGKLQRDGVSDRNRRGDDDGFGDGGEARLVYLQPVNAIGKSSGVQVALLIGLKFGSVLICLAEEMNRCLNASARGIGDANSQLAAIALRKKRRG